MRLPIRLVVVAATAFSLVGLSGITAVSSAAIGDDAPLPQLTIDDLAFEDEPGLRLESRPVVAPDPQTARVGSSAECSEPDENGKQSCLIVGTDAPVASTARAGRAMQGLPAWCLTGERNVLYLARTEACGMYDGYLSILETTGAVTKEVGALAFTLYRYTYMSTRLPQWESQIQVSPSMIRGEAIGTEFSGVATCTGDCAVSLSSFPPQVPTLHGDANGEASFAWPVVPGGIGHAIPSWTVSIKAPSAQNVVSETYGGVPTVRCDQAVPGVATAGCVIPAATPELIYYIAAWPEFGGHLLNAYFSGLPGSWYSGVPLHRLTDEKLKQNNRDRACPQSLNKPAGKSCDEYPFASTWEGAYTARGEARTFAGCQIPEYPIGRTGPLGFSACMIDVEENSLAGSRMNSALFVPYRVIENDTFFVTVE